MHCILSNDKSSEGINIHSSIRSDRQYIIFFIFFFALGWPVDVKNRGFVCLIEKKKAQAPDKLSSKLTISPLLQVERLQSDSVGHWGRPKVPRGAKIGGCGAVFHRCYFRKVGQRWKYRSRRTLWYKHHPREKLLRRRDKIYLRYMAAKPAYKDSIQNTSSLKAILQVVDNLTQPLECFCFRQINRWSLMVISSCHCLNWLNI